MEEEESIQKSSSSFSGKASDQGSRGGVTSNHEHYYFQQPNLQNRSENMLANNSGVYNTFQQYQHSPETQHGYFQQGTFQCSSPPSNNFENSMQNETPNQQRFNQRGRGGGSGMYEIGNQSGGGGGGGAGDFSSNSKQSKFKSFWHIRFSKDYQEILKQNLNDENCLVNVCEPQFYNSHIKLRVLLYPQQGVFSGATIRIYFIVTKDYPYKPVLAFAEEYIYHPNINNNTKQIYWKILDDRDWKPTLTLYFIILQLKFAFLEPDLTFVPNNIENVQCAELFQCNQREFRRKFEMFYQSNDTSTLEKDLSNKMNLEEIQSEDSEKEFSTLNQLEYQFNRNANLGMQKIQPPNFNQQNNMMNMNTMNNEPFKNGQLQFEQKRDNGQGSMFGNNLNSHSNCGSALTYKNNSPFMMQNNLESLTVENFRGDFNFNQFSSNVKHSPNINSFDNQKNIVDQENNNFENHLNLAFSNTGNRSEYNNQRNIFSNSYNNGGNNFNCIDNQGIVKSSASSSESVERDYMANQRMESEMSIGGYPKLQIITSNLSPNMSNKLQNTETALTPTLKNEREQQIRNQFQIEEAFSEDCEEVLLSGDQSSNPSNYLFIQNPFNSTREQSLLITSLLDTTSCQMHPKKRKYQSASSAQNQQNTFDFGKQNKLI